jgi:hypothetical protein
MRGLDDAVLRKAVNGRLLFIDTMLDYAEIENPFQSNEWVVFFKKQRLLITNYGCVAIVMLCHPTKTGGRSSSIDPTEYLKDSVTFGGKIDIGIAMSKLENGHTFVQPIKGRPLKGDKRAFTISSTGEEGENWFDQGRFPVVLKPGEAGRKEDHMAKPGRKADAQQAEKSAS